MSNHSGIFIAAPDQIVIAELKAANGLYSVEIKTTLIFTIFLQFRVVSKTVIYQPAKTNEKLILYNSM